MQEYRKFLVANWVSSLSHLPFQPGGAHRLFSHVSVSLDSCIRCDLKVQTLTFCMLFTKLIKTCTVEITDSINTYQALTAYLVASEALRNIIVPVLMELAF